MVSASSLSAPPTLNVTVNVEAVTERVAAVMFRAPIKVTVPTPGLNCHPSGTVRVSV